MGDEQANAGDTARRWARIDNTLIAVMAVFLVVVVVLRLLKPTPPV